MVKAAIDIPRPDGSVIKKGETLSDELVHEFEASSPQLLDCYVTQNSQYFKKVGKKLIPHKEIMEKDLVEVKVQPKRKIPKPKKSKGKVYSQKEAYKLTRAQQVKILNDRKIKVLSGQKEKDLVHKILKSNPK